MRKRMNKVTLADFLRVDRKTLDREIDRILSEEPLKKMWGTYSRRTGFTETQMRILRENSPLFDI